jgi:thymidylate synthase
VAAAPPRLALIAAKTFDYNAEDIEFVNYQHHAPIKAPVAV